MIELKEEIVDDTHIRHYAEDENGDRYYIKQIETGSIYKDAVDVFPCRYTYEATEDKIIEEEITEDQEDTRENPVL